MQNLISNQPSTRVYTSLSSHFRTSGGSAEFHFKSDWNNKAPPPGLVLFTTSQETSADDTNSHNNDQHHLDRPLDLDNNVITSKPEIFNDDEEVSAFDNLETDANKPVLNSQENENSNSKNQNEPLDLGNSFEAFNYDDDNLDNLKFAAKEPLRDSPRRMKTKNQNQHFGLGSKFESLDTETFSNDDDISQALEKLEFHTNLNEPLDLENNFDSFNSQHFELDNNIETLSFETFGNYDEDPQVIDNELFLNNQENLQSITQNQPSSIGFVKNNDMNIESTDTDDSIIEDKDQFVPGSVESENAVFVSQENQLPSSNSFKTFPLIQDNSASSFPRIGDNAIKIHNSQHHQLRGNTGTRTGGLKINDLAIKSSRLQSQDDRSDYYSHGQTVDDSGVTDGDGVILLVDETGKKLPTSQHGSVMISSLSPPAEDYDTNPFSRQTLQTKQKYFPAEEIDAIPPVGLSEIATGHRAPPVGSRITAESVRSLDSPAGSDKFRAPTTLLYGFKPMTTTESVAPSGVSRPINYYSQSSQDQSPPDPPVKYKQSYKPNRRKPKNLLLQTISSLLRPITQTITNLLRG